MSTENWIPRSEEEVERRFIEMINVYLKLELEYPLPPEMNIKDLKIVNNDTIKNLPPELYELEKKNLVVDSIDILELVIQIEEEFGVIIDDQEIPKLLSWKDLIGYITDSQGSSKIS
jgi:acyl carrier protein